MVVDARGLVDGKGYIQSLVERYSHLIDVRRMLVSIIEVLINKHDLVGYRLARTGGFLCCSFYVIHSFDIE